MHSDSCTTVHVYTHIVEVLRSQKSVIQSPKPFLLYTDWSFHVASRLARHCFIPTISLPLSLPLSPSMPAILVFTLMLAVGFWLHRVYHAARRFLQFWEIRTFYHHALGITQVRNNAQSLHSRPTTVHCVREYNTCIYMCMYILC